MTFFKDLVHLGVATLHEASGRLGLVDAEFMLPKLTPT